MKDKKRKRTKERDKEEVMKKNKGGREGEIEISVGRE
jgi:hypothetical protein